MQAAGPHRPPLPAGASIDRLILTAADVHGLTTLEAHEAWIRLVAQGLRDQGYANEPQLIRSIFEVATDAEPAVARVNHSVWLADCPGGDRGAVKLVPGHPFMCPFCCNVALGGRWRPVTWPADVAGIEAALERRMYVHNRNWDGADSVAQLLAENAANPEAVRVSA